MLYRRQDNTNTNWRLVADTTTSPIMLYNTSASYGEFAATSGPAPTVKISGPTNSCSGAATTLQIPNQGSGNIRWSTGETSTAIKVAISGTYWVEVTYDTGCVARDEVQVSITNEPMPSLPVEAFTCYGEPVILDATTEGAVYRWSNGETTPKISVTTPALYTVEISLKDCQYVREVLVSNDECPAIPNIITPNGDGKNDKFEVQGVEQNTLELKIHNRWGKVVYQTKGYDNSWSGSDMPAGIYYYQLSSSRTERIYKGWIEVVR